MCKSSPQAECRPEYCGGCIARFFDEAGDEVHCEQGKCFLTSLVFTLHLLFLYLLVPCSILVSIMSFPADLLPVC